MAKNKSLQINEKKVILFLIFLALFYTTCKGVSYYYIDKDETSYIGNHGGVGEEGPITMLGWFKTSGNDRNQCEAICKEQFGCNMYTHFNKGGYSRDPSFKCKTMKHQPKMTSFEIMKKHKIDGSVSNPTARRTTVFMNLGEPVDPAKGVLENQMDKGMSERSQIMESLKSEQADVERMRTSWSKENTDVTTLNQQLQIINEKIEKMKNQLTNFT